MRFFGMFFLPLERFFFAISEIFTDFWPLGTSKNMVLAWEVLHFSEKSLKKNRDFFGFCSIFSRF